MSKKLISLVLVLAITGMASAIQWIGPAQGSTPGDWNVAANWDSLRTPVASDTNVKVYLSSGLGANVYVDTAVSGGAKTQMATLGINTLEVRNGGTVSESGSWELYNVTDTITIRGGGVINACTTSGSFKLASNTNGTSTNVDVVDVYGRLNVKGSGSSVLNITNDTRGVNAAAFSGTVNIYNMGIVDVDLYAIGTYGVGKINLSQGGLLRVLGDKRVQVRNDITAGKITGQDQYGGGLDISDVLYDGSYTYIPEPATIALLGMGSLMLLRRKR